MPDAGHDLAEIVGTQIAWWQLGFTQRRRAVRLAGEGRRHPDPDVRSDAERWARQVLEAPWWWRLARAIVINGFAVLGIASTASVLIELPASYAISATVLVVAPLAVVWAWRQTRNARLIEQLQPEEDARALPRWLPIARLAAAFLAVISSVAVIVTSVQQDQDEIYGCVSLPENARIREWWLDSGGRAVGCPTGEVGTTAAGEPYVGLTSGVMTFTSTIGRFWVPKEIFAVWQTNWQALGDPLGAPLADGRVEYVNFQRGHLFQTKGEQPHLVLGANYQPKQHPGVPCVEHDRPCVVSARRDGTKIRVTWHWGSADAFNVFWKRAGDTTGTSFEVAGFEHTLTDADSVAAYVVRVQACDKRFLLSSVCTPYSDHLVTTETR